MTNSCPLCHPKNERVVFSGEKFRVIRVEDPDFPGYFRVIWNDHVMEMSDLSERDRVLLWSALDRVERVMRETLKPAKINLAQFGTMVPHLHWHLIARYPDDASYPDSYWSPKSRKTDPTVLEQRLSDALSCEEKIKAAFR